MMTECKRNQKVLTIERERVNAAVQGIAHSEGTIAVSCYAVMSNIYVDYGKDGAAGLTEGAAALNRRPDHPYKRHSIQSRRCLRVMTWQDGENSKLCCDLQER